MPDNYLVKQSKDKPAFPDLIWDKPETKSQAGKLLIIGGNAHSFSGPASSFMFATKAGAGTAKVLLPDALKKIVGAVLENGEYTPSNKSGGFSKKALSSWLDFAGWADGVFLPGDLGRNSETMVVLESFIERYHGITIITKDALDHLVLNPELIVDREYTFAVASFAQLQKLAIKSRSQFAFTFEMPIRKLIENLHMFTTIHSIGIVLRHNQKIFVAKDGDISVTDIDDENKIWRVEVASRVSVWAIQNPSKLFAAATTAVLS